MPELPEVETIKRGIAPHITGQTIVSVARRNSQPSQHPDGQMYVDEQLLEQSIIGSTIIGVRRRAKVLIIDLSSDVSLLVHLKMTGQIVFEEQKQVKAKGSKVKAGTVESTSHSPFPPHPLPTNADKVRFGGGHPTKSLIQKLPDKSTRTIIVLSNKSTLYFNDQRKFGWIKAIPTEDIDSLSFFQKVGPEPFGPDHTVQNLKAKLSRRTIALKTALLDQSTVAGIGNIYADEALNLARLSPMRPANTLTAAELKRLHQAIPKAMQDSIDRGGTSFSDYVNHLGLFGDYLQHARVFNQTGKPCPNCARPISKIKLNGRGTHYCPHCQK